LHAAIAFFLLSLTTPLAAICASDGVDVAPPFDIAALHPFSLDGCREVTPDGRDRGSCDPLNLVFPDSSAADVQESLVSAGWTVSGFGSPQTVLIIETHRQISQTLQLFKEDRGTLEGPGSRFHLRLWEVPGGPTVGAVHHEAGLFVHFIDQDWEAAEAEVRQDLCTAADCSTGPRLEEQSRLQGGDDEWRGRHNDARPTHIPLHERAE
jgi:hypothetical protein